MSFAFFRESHYGDWSFISYDASDIGATLNGRKINDVSWGPPENPSTGVQLMNDEDGDYFGKDDVILSCPEDVVIMKVSNIGKSNGELFKYLKQIGEFEECKILMKNKEDTDVIISKSKSFGVCAEKCMVLCQDKKKVPVTNYTLATSKFRIDMQDKILTVNDSVFEEHNQEYIKLVSNESLLEFMSNIDEKISRVIVSGKYINQFYTEIKSKYLHTIMKLKVMSQVNIHKQNELMELLVIKRNEYLIKKRENFIKLEIERAQRDAERAQRDAERFQREAERKQRDLEQDAERFQREAERKQRDMEREAERIRREAERTQRETERTQHDAQRNAQRNAQRETIKNKKSSRSPITYERTENGLKNLRYDNVFIGFISDATGAHYDDERGLIFTYD